MVKLKNGTLTKKIRKKEVVALVEVELVLSSSLFSSLSQTLVIVLPNVIENGSNEFKT